MSTLQTIQTILPEGLNAAAVAVRKAAIIEAQPGIDNLRAELFAVDAEQQQAWSDGRHGQQRSAKTEAEKIASIVLEAVRAEPSNLAAASSSAEGASSGGQS